MAEDLPWMIERDDQDPAGSYLLSFSDEVADGREDLVERAERFLPTIPGIDEAFRADRELIVVRAPGLAAPISGLDSANGGPGCPTSPRLGPNCMPRSVRRGTRS